MIEKKNEFTIKRRNKLYVVRLYAAKESKEKASMIVERQIIKRITEGRV